MSINILDTNTDNLVGLSPPSDSMMMQRRKSLQKGQSLQLNRLNNNSKVLSIQVCQLSASAQSLSSCCVQDLVGPVPVIMTPSCWNDPAPHHQGRLHSPAWRDRRPVSPHHNNKSTRVLTSVQFLYNYLSVCLDHSPFIWFILTYGCVYVNLSLSDFHFSSGREK